MKHDWKRDEDGDVDMFAAEAGFCNGPFCQRCYETFCVHCKQIGHVTGRGLSVRELLDADDCEATP